MTAKKLTRKKRLVEVFLYEKLGHELIEVENEAHILEHAFSDDTIDRLNKYLKNPKKCPHGKQIPNN